MFTAPTAGYLITSHSKGGIETIGKSRSGRVACAVTVAVLVLVLTVVFAPLACAETGTSGNKDVSSESRVLKNIPELSWTRGEPFPVVDGVTIFPTLAPSDPSYSTHWYAGSIYPWYLFAQNAQTISTSITVPYSAPSSDEFYYVLLSAWDDAGSYDQIGFSDSYGTWGLTYSWTSGPIDNLEFHYSPNVMALSLGVTYTFYITTESGVTHFSAYQGSTKVWSLNAPTGGNYLILSNAYTDYEEVWQTSTPGGSPAFDFYFDNNYWISSGGGSNATTWNTFSSSAPSNVAVVINGNAVLVHNPSAPSISASPTSGSVNAGSSISTKVSLSPFYYGFENTVSLSASGLPVGDTASFSLYLGAPGFNSTLTISTASTTLGGTYSITITGTGGGVTYSTTYTLTIQVEVTFAQSGVGSDFTGTVVTIDGTNYSVSSLPASFWWNSGSTHSFSYASPLSVSGGKRYVWTSTTGLSTAQSGSLTVTGSGSVTGNYVTQFQENVSYSTSDNSTPSSAPVLSGTGNGSSFAYAMTTTPETVWLDNGTSWYTTNPITTGSGTEQWIATSGAYGMVTGAITIAPVYYHQYLVTASYSTSDSSSPSGSIVLTGKENRLTYTLTLATSTQTAWLDATTPWSVDNLITASSGTEQWIATSGAYGTVTGVISIAPMYYHQYHVSVELNPATGGSVLVGSGWFGAGATFQTTASANPGWQFEGWNGSGEGSYSGVDNTASTVVGAPLVETATFYPGLTITASSGISVSYTYGATSGFIPEGTSQTIFAPQGTNITLTASPTLFIYSFSGWTGSTISSESTISVVLNSPLSLTANCSFNYVNIGILSAVVTAAVIVLTLTIRRVRGGSHRRRGPRHLRKKFKVQILPDNDH
jgi:hypothetical protein